VPVELPLPPSSPLSNATSFTPTATPSAASTRKTTAFHCFFWGAIYFEPNQQLSRNYLGPFAATRGKAYHTWCQLCIATRDSIDVLKLLFGPSIEPG
jgi:hypothetical protein